MGHFADYRPVGGLDRLAVTVREAVAGDLDAMACVQVNAGRAVHPDGWLRAMTESDRLLVVAETADQVVGWAQTHHHVDPQDVAPAGHYLGGVTVDPDRRRRGVAVALTDARMRWIATRADEAYYVVNPANQASIDLHRRWGFEEVTRAARLIGVEFTGGIGILMRARLTQPGAVRRAT